MSFSASLEKIVQENRNGLLGAAPGWKRTRLGDAATVLNGFPFPSSRFSKAKGTPLLRIRDVLAGQTQTYFDGPFEEQYFIKQGDLLVGMDGDFHSARWRGGPALLNQRVCKLMPDPTRLDIRFLTYVLPGYLAAVNAETSAITVKHLSSKTILDLPIPIPPLPAQVALVAEIEKQFTRLDAGVEALKRLQAHLRRYRAAVLKAACEGRLEGTPQPLADGGSSSTGADPKLPAGWRWSPLGSLLTRIQAGKNFRCEERPPGASEFGVVKVSAVTWGTFDSDESKTCLDASRLDEDLIIQPGDFLFSRANTIQLVGACVIAGAVTRRLMLSDKILRFTIADADPRWVLWMLRSPWGRAEIERLASGNQESMRNIGQDRIRQVRIPLPPPAEQQRLVGVIERQLSAADATSQSAASGLRRASRLRAAVLNVAFSGRLTQAPNSETTA